MSSFFSRLAFLLAAIFVCQNSEARVQDECFGCHTDTRVVPQRRIERFKIGIWNDRQCFGCHDELVSIASDFVRGIKGPRYEAMPFRDEMIQNIAARKLPYLNSPLSIEPSYGGINRIDKEELLQYLKQPVAFESGWHMLSFPDITSDDIDGLAYLNDRPRENASAERGGKIWREMCVSCHGSNSHRLPRLAIYSPRWLFEWVIGKQSHAPDLNIRTMPTISISEDDAHDISAYLKKEAAALRSKAEYDLKDELKQKQSDFKLSEPTDAAVRYIWNGFLRDAKCVHCHAGDQRASSRFLATPAGLASYVSRNNPLNLWERLERRSFEVKSGIGLQKPGMPMGGPPVPEELRHLIKSWSLTGCKRPDGLKLCPPEKK